MKKITLEDWYDTLTEFEKTTNAKLCWGLGFMGWDFDDGEAININRDFLKLLNARISNKEPGDGEI